MLGHVYVVEDAKDLAQIVRDVTRYGGAYRPEVRDLCWHSQRILCIEIPSGHLRVYTAASRLEEDRENSGQGNV